MDTGKSSKSSILKPKKPRNPLADLDFAEPAVEDDGPIISSRRSSMRRVSFANSNFIKEFATDHEKNTIWVTTYEETLNKSDSTQSSDESHKGVVTQDSINISSLKQLPYSIVNRNVAHNRIEHQNKHTDKENNMPDYLRVSTVNDSTLDEKRSESINFNEHGGEDISTDSSLSDGNNSNKIIMKNTLLSDQFVGTSVPNVTVSNMCSDSNKDNKENLPFSMLSYQATSLPTKSVINETGSFLTDKQLRGTMVISKWFCSSINPSVSSTEMINAMENHTQPPEKKNYSSNRTIMTTEDMEFTQEIPTIKIHNSIVNRTIMDDVSMDFTNQILSFKKSTPLNSQTFNLNEQSMELTMPVTALKNSNPKLETMLNNDSMEFTCNTLNYQSNNMVQNQTIATDENMEFTKPISMLEEMYIPLTDKTIINNDSMELTEQVNVELGNTAENKTAVLNNEDRIIPGICNDKKAAYIRHMCLSLNEETWLALKDEAVDMGEDTIEFVLIENSYKRGSSFCHHNMELTENVHDEKVKLAQQTVSRENPNIITVNKINVSDNEMEETKHTHFQCNDYSSEKDRTTRSDVEVNQHIPVHSILEDKPVININYENDSIELNQTSTEHSNVKINHEKLGNTQDNALSTNTMTVPDNTVDECTDNKITLQISNAENIQQVTLISPNETYMQIDFSNNNNCLDSKIEILPLNNIESFSHHQSSINQKQKDISVKITSPAICTSIINRHLNLQSTLKKIIKTTNRKYVIEDNIDLSLKDPLNDNKLVNVHKANNVDCISYMDINLIKDPNQSHENVETVEEKAQNPSSSPKDPVPNAANIQCAPFKELSMINAPSQFLHAPNVHAKCPKTNTQITSEIECNVLRTPGSSFYLNFTGADDTQNLINYKIDNSKQSKSDFSKLLIDDSILLNPNVANIVNDESALGNVTNKLKRLSTENIDYEVSHKKMLLSEPTSDVMNISQENITLLNDSFAHIVSEANEFITNITNNITTDPSTMKIENNDDDGCGSLFKEVMSDLVGFKKRIEEQHHKIKKLQKIAIHEFDEEIAEICRPFKNTALEKIGESSISSSESSLDEPMELRNLNSFLQINSDLDMEPKILTLTEKIENSRKRSKQYWNISLIEEDKYEIETLFKTICLIVQVKDENGIVEKINVSSNIKDSAEPVALFVHNIFKEKVSQKYIQAAVGEQYDILTLLDYVYLNMQKMMDILIEFDKYMNWYGLEMDCNFRVTFKIITLQLRSTWVISIDMRDLDNISENSVTVSAQFGKVNETEVKRIAKGCPKGMSFLSTFINKVASYSELLTRGVS